MLALGLTRKTRKPEKKEPRLPVTAAGLLGSER
jgi:hypothetical protein